MSMGVRYAFVSVSDKTGLVPLARALVRADYALLCTDGTLAHLHAAGVSNLVRVAAVTGYPEMLDGRVKSLHPALFGGILADRDAVSHRHDIALHSLPDIGMVVANFYPFWSVGDSHTLDQAIALIDVGGVAAVRAAAKNYRHVTVLTHPAQYDRVLPDPATTSLQVRRQLAHEAFALTASYDTNIAHYLQGASAALPDTLTRSYRKVSDLKYGLNPHQKPAALYSSHPAGAAPLQLLHGQWGYINILDAVHAWGLVAELSRLCNGAAAAASFKHTLPAGAAVHVPWEHIAPASRRLLELSFGVNAQTAPSVLAYARARNADPLSSFGDFVGYSGIVDEPLARFLQTQIADGIVAAGYTDEALALLRAKKGGRFVVLRCDSARLMGSGAVELRDVGGGMTLAQTALEEAVDAAVLQRHVPTARHALPEDALRDLAIANAALRFAQSNAVAAAAQGQLIAVAAGQQSRVDAVRLAGQKARVWLGRHSPTALEAFSSASGPRQDRIVAATNHARTHGLGAGDAFSPEVCLASDGFFPFADGVQEAAAAVPGLRYISQPGGSVRDADVVAACDELGLVMCMTGVRVFTH